MKLVRRFYTCVLFAVCGCTHVITMEDFVQTVDQHNHETINNVWYMGSKGKYDFFRHNTTLYSCTYKIYDGMADTTDRISLTSNRDKWLLIKGNSCIVMDRIKATPCNITNAVIIFSNTNKYNNGGSRILR